MKRLFISLALITMIGLLAGCISIPLGDDTLEISSDGIKLYKGGQSEAIEEDAEDKEEDADLEDEPDAEDDTDADADTDIDTGDEAEADESDAADTTGVAETSEAKMFSNGTGATCPDDINTDYSRIEKTLFHDFYLPDCADITKINLKDDRTTFDFTIHGGDFEELFDDYIDFMDEVGNQEYDPTYYDGWARVTGNLVNSAGEVSSVDVTITQRDEESRVGVSYRFPEEEEEEEED